MEFPFIYVQAKLISIKSKFFATAANNFSTVDYVLCVYNVDSSKWSAKIRLIRYKLQSAMCLSFMRFFAEKSWESCAKWAWNEYVFDTHQKMKRMNEIKFSTWNVSQIYVVMTSDFSYWKKNWVNTTFFHIKLTIILINTAALVLASPFFEYMKCNFLFRLLFWFILRSITIIIYWKCSTKHTSYTIHM